MTSDHPGESNIGKAFLTVVWALVIIVAAIISIVTVGTLYFAVSSKGGSWSALNHVFFLIKSSPLLLLLSLGLGWWIATGEEPVNAKLSAVTAFLFLYNLIHLVNLIATY